MTDAEFRRIVGDIKVDIYQRDALRGMGLVCRQSTLADCYPGEFETQCAAAWHITNGRPFVTQVATLRPASF